WGTIEKSGEDLVIVAPSDAPIDDDEEILARLKNDGLILEELPSSFKEAAVRLTRRNLVESRVRNDREVEITEAGRNLGSRAPSQPEVSSLTGDLIASGEWEKVKLRRFVSRKLVTPSCRSCLPTILVSSRDSVHQSTIFFQARPCRVLEIV